MENSNSPRCVDLVQNISYIIGNVIAGRIMFWDYDSRPIISLVDVALRLAHCGKNAVKPFLLSLKFDCDVKLLLRPSFKE